MKKKMGPLPLWAWIVVVGGAIGAYLLYRSNSSSSTTANANTVDPSSPTGLTYGQEAQDQAMGIDPATGETYAQEQAAAAAAGTTGTASGGGGDSGSGTTAATATDSGIDPSTGVPYGEEILSAISGGGLTDQNASQTPAQTFGGEISDVVGGITALQAAGLLGTPTPATATKKSAPALTAKDAKRAPSGPTKPSAPKGFKSVGLGSGNWEFTPIITSKVKTTTTAPRKQTTTTAHKKVTVSGSKKKK